ncbi:hypothetical protein [Sphingobium sp. YR768]|uniref:hypothetical protein n=1 Tax=Sphingobium sp. YR768 TaxID=1884365 RepID=UPI0008D0B292|nr:hypothetical protein [Sphingobium sp. YR768]SER25384.1 hypothetical protein SAMN05518866_107122 [Sphingobium sp. YR768]
MKRHLSRTRAVSIDWPLLSRILAAVVGGYALTSLLTLLATYALPLLGVPMAQALHATTMASFLAYAAIIMAVFHAASATRAWTGLMAAAVPTGMILLAIRLGAAS